MPYLQEMSQAYRQKLPKKDFVFPDQRKWPIQTRKQAMTALTYSTWPQHKSVANKVRKVVFAKYPGLRQSFKKGQHRNKSKGLGKLGESQAISSRLGRIHDLVGQANSIKEHQDPSSVAQMFVDEEYSDNKKVADAFGRKVAAAAVKIARQSGIKFKGGTERTFLNAIARDTSEQIVFLMVDVEE
jgi:hypothetical protein